MVAHAPARVPSRAEAVAKRALDIVGALLGLLLAAPLLLLLAVAIWLESPGNVIFAHYRLGVGGRAFRCFKLRTMLPNAEVMLWATPEMLTEYRQNNFKLPLAQDRRVTGLGRLLRRTSLDEVPQFWNVLRGEMSLVGPRPIVPDELRHYGAEADVLLSMRPGMSGAWAVRGRSTIGYPERAAIEVDYVRNWQLGHDVRILLHTLAVVWQRRGAC